MLTKILTKGIIFSNKKLEKLVYPKVGLQQGIEELIKGYKFLDNLNHRNS